MKKIIRLTESDLTRIVRRVINEADDEKLVILKQKINGIKNTGTIEVSVTNQNANVSFTDKYGKSVNENILVSDFPFVFGVSLNPATEGTKDKTMAQHLKNYFEKIMLEGKTINISITYSNATFTFPGRGNKSGETLTETIPTNYLAFVFSFGG
jgi:hypothetical protein